MKRISKRISNQIDRLVEAANSPQRATQEREKLVAMLEERPAPMKAGSYDVKVKSVRKHPDKRGITVTLLVGAVEVQSRIRSPKV